MLTITGPATFDACSYFHFLQWVGLAGACNEASGLILVHQSELPNLWPTPLFHWSVLLATEPIPCFLFSQPIAVTFENQTWLALQATPTTSLSSLMQRFGWSELPLCLIAPLEANFTLPKSSDTPTNVYATCHLLHIRTETSDQPLTLAFNQVAVQNNHVTAVTYQVI
jgi:hypothetical protein